jgi:beta-glucosidase
MSEDVKTKIEIETGTTKKRELVFPEGFYWGAATAAYQVEGGIENTDWAEAAREDRVPEAGMSSDHWNRYDEDFDIVKELGHNAHRLSIEWARIEPEEGAWNREALDHYREVLKALHRRGIQPYLTLWHFTLPLWFSQTGGFERKDAPEIFARYAAFVTEELGEYCGHFSTMNEPIVFANNGWLRGSWPPFKRFPATDYVSITNAGKTYETKAEKRLVHVWQFLRVRRNLVKAHNLAYRRMKAKRPDAVVSVVRDVIVFDAGKNPLHKILAWFSNWQWNHRFMKRTYKQCDEIGINYYFYKKFGDAGKYPKTDMGWDARPEKIRDALRMFKRYDKPLFVSEAGLADDDDDMRAWYIKEQARGTWEAIFEDGVDVVGHMYWSLLDNYEWALGYEKRFGLVEIDYTNFKRTIRPSAYVYKKICEENKVVIEEGR